MLEPLEQLNDRRFRIAERTARLIRHLETHVDRTPADLGYGPIELEAVAQLCDLYELPATARAVRELIPTRQVHA